MLETCVWRSGFGFVVKASGLAFSEPSVLPANGGILRLHKILCGEYWPLHPHSFLTLFRTPKAAQGGETCSFPSVDRIWGRWGPYYSIPTPGQYSIYSRGTISAIHRFLKPCSGMVEDSGSQGLTSAPAKDLGVSQN